jgi:quercetin dioxygenase-like cupin family protein
MADRTIDNPVTGERATYIETSHETGSARSVIDVQVEPGGGVPTHRHAGHDELIEVLEGEIEVTIDGARRRFAAGERVVIERGMVHAWRNPVPDRRLRFRGMMTPGHPGFESVLRVLFGLARDGEVRRNGIPKRLSDVGLLIDLDPSLAAGMLRLIAPLARWSARRPSARRRATELLRRYGCERESS